MKRLRAPDGCPWDQEQRIGDVRAYLLEEAHEAAAAIDEGDPPALRDELGDLLFQVVFLSVLAEEGGDFTLRDVVDRVEEKMVERHPHVFGDERLSDANAVRRAWEERKRRTSSRSLLAGVPSSLPALVAAYRMTQKAAAVGFDWRSPHEVLAKVEEEMGELRQAMTTEPQRVAEELGDVFFSLANLARHCGLDPEAVAAAANQKFRHRFEYLERHLDLDGDVPEGEMERLWHEAKQRRHEDGDGASD